MPIVRFKITKISVYFEQKTCVRCKQPFTITDEKHKRRKLCDECRGRKA